MTTQPSSEGRVGSLAKSVLHNLGVVAVGFGVALLGTAIDTLVSIPRFDGLATAVVGWSLLALGFLLRVWATFHFYERRMRVISLSPQTALITTGPYRFTRNPLYLGGNVFVFFGAALVLGTPSGLILTALHLPLMDAFVRREERQLAADFGDAWQSYAAQVRRWL